MANKYGAKSCEEDGYRFASIKERAYYRELKLRARAGEVGTILVHPSYPLRVGDRIIGKMTLDFAYMDLTTGEMVYVDVKGGRATKTEAYSLRKRVWEACYHPWKITEV